MAHGVNRVAEEIRNQFPIVNDFINNVKAPLRVQLYKETLPDVPLPPKPILTRSGTWVEAALFYSEHFKGIKKVLSELSEDSSAAISESNRLAANLQLNQQLAYIKNHFSMFPKLFLELEKQEVLLVDSINLTENFRRTMNSLNGKIGKCISKKLNDTLSKNKGYQILKDVSIVLNGDFVEGLQIAPNILSALSNAPITSVDVERSFSAYKLILSDRRQSFLAENIEKHLIVSVYRNISSSSNINKS